MIALLPLNAARNLYKHSSKLHAGLQNLSSQNAAEVVTLPLMNENKR